MPPYSQPAPEMQTSAGSEAPQGTASSFDVKLSLVASYAHSLGDPDGVRDLLAPGDREAFDRAYAVQADRAGVERQHEDQRIKDSEKRKLRLGREAKEELAEDERQALFSASESSGTFTLLSPAELNSLPEAEPLIEGFLVKESLVRLYGPPKSYKSFIMLDMAACVGAGIKWCGRKVTPAKVLYVVAEGVRGINRRVRAWEALNKRAMTGVHFYDRAVQLGDRKDVSMLIATAKSGGFEFIVLDTQARCTVGLEENSASEMGVVVAALDVLKEVTGACVALVHHSGASGGRARGSTAILGALDAEFEVDADKTTMSVSMKTIAQKDLAEANSVEFDLTTPGPGMSLAVKPRMQWYKARPEDLPALPTHEMRVLALLNGFGDVGATVSVIAKGMPDADPLDVRRAVGSLERKDCIKLKGATCYVGQKGLLHLEAASRQLPIEQN